MHDNDPHSTESALVQILTAQQQTLTFLQRQGSSRPPPAKKPESGGRALSLLRVLLLALATVGLLGLWIFLPRAVFIQNLQYILVLPCLLLALSKPMMMSRRF